MERMNNVHLISFTHIQNPMNDAKKKLLTDQYKTKAEKNNAKLVTSTKHALSLRIHELKYLIQTWCAGLVSACC